MNAVGTNPRLSTIERALLEAQTEGTAPVLLLRTGTRVDTGRWFRRSALWLCVTDSDLILLSAGRRQYVERMPLRSACESWYCHTTGQFVIEPAERLRFGRVDLSPTDALHVLRYIQAATASSDRKAAEFVET